MEGGGAGEVLLELLKEKGGCVVYHLYGLRAPIILENTFLVILSRVG